MRAFTFKTKEKYLQIESTVSRMLETDARQESKCNFGEHSQKKV